MSLYLRYIRALILRISTNVPDEEQEEEMGIEDGFLGGGGGGRGTGTDREGPPGTGYTMRGYKFSKVRYILTFIQ